VSTVKKLSMGLAIAALIGFIHCGGAGIDGTAPRVYENAKKMVAEARAGITEISVEALKISIENEEEFILIDVREADEFDEGSIPGAFNLPRGLLEFKIASESFWDGQGMYVPEKNEEMILYCKKGGRGALATEALVKLGYKKVRNVAGGWVVWEYGPEALEEEEEKPEEGGCGG
jgi:rhodanese-related sulfurtransferase